MQVDFEGFYEQYNLKSMTVEEINYVISHNEVDRNKISDKYHTFGELYEHRITLFIALANFCFQSPYAPFVWKSKKHHDGTSYEGWFIMGIGDKIGEQISYHLPISKWDECEFAKELELAPEWDGHTSADVLDRIKKLPFIV